MNRKIPFSPPDITDREKEYILEVLDSGWITTGNKTKHFENQIAKYTCVSRAVCLNSATAAMELTLRLLGVGPGDEVITGAYTYTASASVIDHVGAKIVMCDVTDSSFLIDIDAIEKLITSNTKAIIPVDIGGGICDYDALQEILENKKYLYTPQTPMQEAIGRIAIIADAAHSFGSLYKGRPSGSLADFTCFSFHAVKNLTTAEGGAVTWKCNPNFNDDDIYQSYMLYALHGQSKDALAKNAPGAWEYDILSLGYKCNMTDISAALGLAQFERYPHILGRRREIACIYNDFLSTSYIETPEACFNVTSNNHLYMTRIKGADEIKRNNVIRKLAEMDISVNVHYRPLPMFTAYRNLGFDIVDFPKSYAQYCNEISLPIYSTMSDDDALYVAQAYKKAL